MQRKSKFVIGGGISGLIYAFYNKDYWIISPELGGKLKNDYLASTILLHDTAETRKLITDIGFSIKPRARLIRYFYNGELLENIPINLREIMAAKKLTSWDKLNNLKINVEVTDTTLSTNDIYIPVLDNPVNKIVSSICKNINIIKDRVLRITEKELITENSRYEYTDVVSTIPAPIFWKLYGKKKKLGYLPETFVLSETNPVPTSSIHWDLIYFLDRDIPYTRVSRHEGRDFLYEFTGELNREDLNKILPDLKVKQIYTDPFGVIITDLNNVPPPNIRFIGRFATWNHTYKIQDAIKDSLARYNFISIWNKQKEFNSNFFDFNVKDIELQQKLTKNFALHIEDEVHELLQEINWKMDEYKLKEVDRDRLLEEWIDIFKYWLGMGSVWGFGIEDFLNEFWRKSKIVDQRYKKFIKSKKKGARKK